MIVPLGTQIVTLVDIAGRSGVVLLSKGAVGVVTKAPSDETHSYRIRLVDGRELSLHRHEFAVRKDFQRTQAGDTRAAWQEDLPDWRSYIIYSCVVGSRAFGLAHADSDTDRRGVYLPPASLHWSLFGLPEQLEDEQSQECYWELRKFLILALKANPNVLECLYTPLVERLTPIGEQLLAIRSCFLSKLAYQTFNGYVISQFKKLEADIRAKGKPRWKHAMHLVRLLLAGITLLRDGHVLIDVGTHRERLLSIGRGELSWDELERWRLDLHAAFEEAFNHTRLPERPDYETANHFLIEARRAMAEEENRS